MDESTKDFLRDIEISLDVQQFFSGAAGQAIMEKADAHLRSSFDKWKNSDPADERGQAALQLEVRVIERLRNWLQEIISQGDQAESYILNRDKGEVDG
jgi:hypothetical protein